VEAFPISLALHARLDLRSCFDERRATQHGRQILKEALDRNLQPILADRMPSTAWGCYQALGDAKSALNHFEILQAPPKCVCRPPGVMLVLLIVSCARKNGKEPSSIW